MEKMYLCARCISATKSRGEQIFVGELVYTDEDGAACDWCGDDGELYECIVK